MAFSAVSSLRGATERLVGALTDPARRERTVLAVLAVYTLVWTLYGVLARGSQDVHFDMVETVGWSRDLAVGYPKHPPLAAYVARAWFAIFPNTDWSFYLLAILVGALALWIGWKLAGDYLDAEKRVMALALLTFVPFFNFHALKFNVNTVLMPVWPATALFFLRSVETRRPLPAALAGVFAALALLGKYWSIFLILGLGLAVLLDRRRGEYFRSAAPWITILAGALVIAPHVVWLVSHDFAPFTYAYEVHGSRSFWDAAFAGIGYVLGSFGYAALPVVLAWAILRPPLGALSDVVLPESDQRRLILLTFALPILLPAVFAPFGGVKLTSLWTMPAWTLFPVVLLTPSVIVVTREAVVRLTAIAMVMPVVMLLAAPIISIVIHQKGVEPTAEVHSRLLAREVEKVWRATSDKPLRLVGGDQDLAYGVAFYLADRPSVFPYLLPREAPWVNDARIDREGLVILCLRRARECVQMAEQRAAKGPKGQRADVELVRDHFGIAGKPERYVIITMPPVN
jgi:4-amino-4-deoxy-L-arabinose transferase-like glycosyltransferase